LRKDHFAACVGIVANMNAQLVYRHRIDFDDGAILENHCHRDGVETPYTFAGPEKLINDFFREVEERRAR